MFYKFDDRLVIQKANGVKYYVQVLGAEVVTVYPFTIPTLSINVIAGSTKADFLANLRFDDIVRFQVSVKYSPVARTVWTDLFEGRVLTSKVRYGVQNTATIVCVGHAAESSYSIIDEAKTWAQAADLKDVLAYFNKYLSRVQFNVPSNTGITVAYATKQDQKFCMDLMTDAEKLSGFDWYFDTRTVYSANHNLEHVYLDFKRFSQVPTNLYKGIQGTPRLLDSNFTSDGQEVKTNIIIFGDTPSGGTQYRGVASDATNAAKYGLRTSTSTDRGLSSNALCGSFATSVLPNFKDPRVSGQVTIMGTPKAHIGDLVYIKLDKIDLNGRKVDGYYTVVKVTHRIELDAFYTILDLGKVQKGIDDYLTEFALKNKLLMANFIN
jgi:hypothetical protein